MENNITDGYREAYRMAAGNFAEQDPAQMALNAGCGWDEKLCRMSIRFLGDEYWVDPGGQVARADGENAALTVQVLVLHYLICAKKTALTGKQISFREVRGGGETYYPVFRRRAELPLQKAFDSEPGMLVRCGLCLGGTRVDFGSAGVTLPVFPNVPVTYVVWEKEEEIPSSAAVLFDSSVSAFLPCEDIVLAASMGTYALANELRKQAGKKVK